MRSYAAKKLSYVPWVYVDTKPEVDLFSAGIGQFVQLNQRVQSEILGFLFNWRGLNFFFSPLSGRNEIRVRVDINQGLPSVVLIPSVRVKSAQRPPGLGIFLLTPSVRVKFLKIHNSVSIVNF